MTQTNSNNSLINNLHESWIPFLGPELKKDYILDLDKFLLNEENKKKIIYPDRKNILNSFNCVPFKNLKVVIIGQDPYHGQGQAHGLSFSVMPKVKTPPSLKNIFKELKSDLDIQIPNNGFLESWAKQGILLLNSVLTVEEKIPASHKNQGWEIFTDKVVEVINFEKENVVFLLWGNYAIKKGINIDRSKHCVLEAPHPSPFSAYKGFFGCKHFSKTNQYLESKNQQVIDWNLPL
jgi:uracil-DNA glycosylase